MRCRSVGRKEVRSINAQVVRAAETMVFHSVDEEWIPRFVRKHSPFRTATLTDRIPTEGGVYVISRRRIVPVPAEPREENGG